jgi:hypothetical protein
VVTDADDGAWWLAGDGHWHEGTAPSGWVQAGDRRWYPDEPPETAKGYASKFESAGGRTATVQALGRSPDPPALVEAADGGGGGDGDGLAWSFDDPACGLDDDSDDPACGLDGDDGIEGERRRPAWVLVSVLVALLVAVVGVVGVMAQTDDGTDGETGPTVDPAPPSSVLPNSTTTATTTTVEGGPLAPAVTVAPPVSRPSTTVPRRPSTPVPRRPSTTVPPPDTTIAPPSTAPNPGGPPVREGGRCSDVGATAVTSTGTPVTCSSTACDGDPYDEPRWRRTIC